MLLFNFSYSIHQEFQSNTKNSDTLGPVGWVRISANECPDFDTKQSDGEVPVILELWVMQSPPLLPSLAGPLRSGVAA